MTRVPGPGVAPLRQICSWCEAEGVRTVISEGAEPESHGICRDHADELRQSLRGFRAERGPLRARRDG